MNPTQIIQSVMSQTIKAVTSGESVSKTKVQLTKIASEAVVRIKELK